MTINCRSFLLTALTARERQLLDLLAVGAPTTAIARRLGIAPKTVPSMVRFRPTRLRQNGGYGC
jgi:DNA-binding NarL/FixJ family response regulator